MNVTNLLDLLQRLCSERVKVRCEWVTATCPFAPYLHLENSDKHPSFGISVGEESGYHCYSCGQKGRLSYLPTALGYFTKKDYTDLRRFIVLNEGIALTTRRMDKVLSTMSWEEFERRFPEPCPPNYRGLTPEFLKTHLIRFDEAKNRVVIPVMDKHRKLVGIKGRILNDNDSSLKYLFYKEFFDTDPKSCGIWYGMHDPIIPDKFLTIVEGEFDRMILKQSGLVSNVIGSMGASLTKAQLKSLSHYNAPLVLFTDNDPAGQVASTHIKAYIGASKPIYMVTDYCGCKDPLELNKKRLLRKALSSIQQINP